MEGPSTSTSENLAMCKLCNTQPRRYTCPKCEIPYCSLECYKSEGHLECSENFYKDWVETELKGQEQDPESRQKMIDILKRINDPEFDFQHDPVDENDEFEEGENGEGFFAPIDSDDEEDIADLEDRLKSVDFNNADALWAALTEEERQGFEATVRNGEAAKFLPSWTPWWSKSLAKEPIIQEVKEDEPEPNYVAECPAIVEVPAINEIARASPLIQFNLLNVLHAYTYMALHYNGDHQESSRESVAVFLRLSTNMQNNKVFEDAQQAVESVAMCAIDCQSLPGDEEAMAAAKEAVNLITNGPEESAPNFYILAALSDLHNLFTNAKNEISRPQETDRTFSKKFNIDDTEPELSKKTLLLCTKKIDYYLSWVKSHKTRIFPKIL